ncbi:MAG: hypothetical protein ACXW39_09965 [Nitrospira sp.]
MQLPIEWLLGQKGILYLVELSAAAEPFFPKLIAEHGPPPGLARVFQHMETAMALFEPVPHS